MTQQPNKLAKPSAQRVSEFIASLLVLRDCLRHVNEGKEYHVLPIAGQLRSLLAEKSKGNSPLMLEIESFFKMELRLFAGPPVPTKHQVNGVPDPLLATGGLPVSRYRTDATQRELRLSEFLGETIVTFKGKPYARREIIKIMAEQAGGAHHSRSWDEGLATLFAIAINGRSLANDALLQMAHCILQCGADMLRALCEFSIHSSILIARPPIAAGGAIFDFVFPTAPMRITMVQSQLGRLACALEGINGSTMALEVSRMIDWTRPRYVAIEHTVSDELKSTLRVYVDGVVYGETTVDFPVFVLGEPSLYERYWNRFREDENSGAVFAFISQRTVPGPIGLDRRGDLLREFLGACEEREDACTFMKSGWATAAPKASEILCEGPVQVWPWSELAGGRSPTDEIGSRVTRIPMNRGSDEQAL